VRAPPSQVGADRRPDRRGGALDDDAARACELRTRCRTPSSRRSARQLSSSRKPRNVAARSADVDRWCAMGQHACRVAADHSPHAPLPCQLFPPPVHCSNASWRSSAPRVMHRLRQAHRVQPCAPRKGTDERAAQRRSGARSAGRHVALGRVVNCRNGCMAPVHSRYYGAYRVGNQRTMVPRLARRSPAPRNRRVFVIGRNAARRASAASTTVRLPYAVRAEESIFFQFTQNLRKKQVVWCTLQLIMAPL